MKKYLISLLISASAMATPTPTPSPIKISEMPAASSVTGPDLVPIVQSGVNKKVTFTTIEDFSPTWTRPHTWTYSDSATTNATDILTLSHNSSGTAGTNFGTAIKFKAEDSTTNDQDLLRITGAWSDATHATATSYLIFSTRNAGAASSSVASLSGAGGLTIGAVNAAMDAGVIDANTGFRIGSSGTVAGSILQGDGTNFTASPQTWPSATPTTGYKIRATSSYTYAAYPTGLVNSSTGDNTGFSSDTYVTGSAVTVAAGDFKAGGQYRCVFDMAKTGAGTAAPTIDVRIGTAGTTGDTSRMTFTFSAGTAAADTGTFEVIITFRSVGSGTSAVISGICRAQHNLATTGLFSDAAAWTIVGTTSSGFDSSAATKIGISFNGGASFSGTNKVVQAILNQ